ncbi:hypothetical protein [Pseudomonas sp.]|uniref:hypothetical protein n=1 Tax=Pseudomonas sp. TaxID=306 RepID=UPI003FD6F8E2
MQITDDPLADVANAALAHACEAGQVVPADKVREIEAKARAEGVRFAKLDTVDLIQAACSHMCFGRIANSDDLQIILLKAAK